MLSFLTADPPEHGRLRQAPPPFFTPPAVTSLKASMAASVDRIVSVAAAAGGLDVVTHLGGPLSAEAAARILGVPAELGPDMLRWSTTMWALLEPPVDPMATDRAHQAATEAQQLFAQMADQRRRASSDTDLVGALTTMVDAGALSEHDMLSVCTTVMIAAG